MSGNYAQWFRPTLAKPGRGEQGCKSIAPRAGIAPQCCDLKYAGTVAPKYRNLLYEKKLLVYVRTWVLLAGGWEVLWLLLVSNQKPYSSHRLVKAKWQYRSTQLCLKHPLPLVALSCSHFLFPSPTYTTLTERTEAQLLFNRQVIFSWCLSYGLTCVSL